ncbi:type II secretion system protein M [Zhongshania sp.]|jgi:general secretion pathway protein M|uniref:type II secretion system protein M n=1 Tax=Zhongshania sp. TaxID=1971902 RepID=UPI001B49466B|nr:type II secretion system protein M [Zhongshania sp.]MBQ0796671.1 type II secretion system protein M [Zhongshania sp.]|tara:strand:- start:38401 stop:38883 length:483 start_codon:yes stop_codon:yes gene_type:complete
MKLIDRLLEGRNERERQILIIGAIVAIPLIIWMLIWQPLLKANEAAEARLDQRRQSYAWMQQATARVTAMRGSVSQSAALTGSPQQQITGAAAALAVNINRIEPQSGGRYSVWVAKTDYSSAVQFIETLSVAGMTLYSANMTLLDSPGSVSLRASLGVAE